MLTNVKAFPVITHPAEALPSSIVRCLNTGHQETLYKLESNVGVTLVTDAGTARAIVHLANSFQIERANLVSALLELEEEAAIRDGRDI